MADWSEGYVSDVTYTHGYYRELNPWLQRFACLSKATAAPDPAEGFTYCELGFGQGLSTNILAAANPNGQFYATDFNPSQAHGAQRLAKAAGLENINFYDDSFKDFIARDELPQFDFIGLHGIWSWISPENREAIVAFIRRKLKVGGVAYVSYNTLPGWAGVMPLRELMLRHAEQEVGPLIERIDHAIAFAQAVEGNNAGYFGNNPVARQRLELVAKHNRNYLAHEYFNRDWEPMYFADAVEALSAGKLDFIGSVHLTDHIDSVSLPGPVHQHLATLKDPIFRETVRDYYVNQQFRRDLFGRGSLRLNPIDLSEALRAQRFALVVPRAAVQMTQRFNVGEVSLREDTYGPLADVLAEGVHSIDALTKEPRLKHLTLPALLEALKLLTAVGYAQPAAQGTPQKQAARSTQRLNKALMRQARGSAEVGFLASPVMGAGVAVDRFEQLFLLARQEQADPVAVVWRTLSQLGQKIIAEGKTLESEAENMAEIKKRYDTFEAERLGLLKTLGVA